MRYAISVAMFLAFALSIGASTSTLPTTNLACGKDLTVYQNAVTVSAGVVAQVTGGCSGATIWVYDGKNKTSQSNTYSVRSGETEAFSLSVEPGGHIEIKCAGSGSGGCSYTLSLP